MTYFACQIGLSMGPLFAAAERTAVAPQSLIHKSFDPFIAPVVTAVLALGIILSCFVGVFIWRITKNPGDDAERRSSPWIALDLITVVLFFLLAFSASWQFIDTHIGITRDQSAQSDTAHPLAKLASSGDTRLLILSVASGVVVTPICEEVFFRVLFLGWLNAVMRNAGRYFSLLRRPSIALHLPLFISSLLFASMHIRVDDGSKMSLASQSAILIALGFSQAATIAFAVVLLCWRVGAAALDFGWNARRMPKDFLLGTLIFLTAVAPLYMLQYSLSGIVPKGVAPDPGPMFVFAYLVGLLYLRTGRIAPCIAVHMALNALGIYLS